jgi:predicted transcriptional regulator
MSKSQSELGPLQQAVMEYAWEHPGCSVRDCRDALALVQGKEHAYTTIQTVFDALHAKRLLTRRRAKNAFHYTARKSRGDFLLSRFQELLARLGMAPQPVASSLIDALETGDGEELRALVAELKARGYVE